MIFSIELIFEFFLIYKVWTEKDRTNLFLWFLTAGIMLMPSFRLGVSVPSCNWMFSIVVLLRVIFLEKNIIEKWNKFPLKNIYVVLLIFHFLQPLFVRYESITQTYFYVVKYVMNTYLYVFWGFCVAPNYNKLKEKKQWVITWIIVLFVIAVISKLITYNFITSSLNADSIWSSERAETERGFRVTGPVASPNVFGYINVLIALFIYQVEMKSYIKYFLIFAVICNLFLCGTRAPLMGFLIASSIYSLFVSKGKIVRIIVTSFICFLVIFNFIGTNETISNYLNNFTDLILTGGENTKGSSTDLREIQLTAAIKYANDNPVMGNGNGYAGYLMSDRENSLYNDDLHGSESYIFFMLIDYGYIYIGIVFAYYCYLFFFFIKYRVRKVKIVMLAISTTIALLSHLITSRPNNSWQIFMPVIGACLYMLIDENERKNIKVESKE